MERDTTLPPFYLIKNCILLASALNDWDEADDWRHVAEAPYKTNFHDSRTNEDADSLKVLECLRAELDELKQFREEDMAALYKEMNGDDNIDNEEGEYDDEDEGDGTSE